MYTYAYMMCYASATHYTAIATHKMTTTILIRYYNQMYGIQHTHIYTTHAYESNEAHNFFSISLPLLLALPLSLLFTLPLYAITSYRVDTI